MNFKQWLTHEESIEEGVFKNTALAGALAIGSLFGGTGMARAAEKPVVIYNAPVNGPVTMVKDGNTVTLTGNFSTSLGATKGKMTLHQRMTGLYKSEAEKKLGANLEYTGRTFEGKTATYTFTIR